VEHGPIKAIANPWAKLQARNCCDSCPNMQNKGACMQTCFTQCSETPNAPEKKNYYIVKCVPHIGEIPHIAHLHTPTLHMGITESRHHQQARLCDLPGRPVGLATHTSHAVFLPRPKCDPHVLPARCRNVLHGGQVSQCLAVFEPGNAHLTCTTRRCNR
jgi:hypothetical protein